MSLVKITQVKQPVRCKYEIDVHYKVFPIDRSGNTYHRVKIGGYLNGTDTPYSFDSGVTYGYDEHYKQTAYNWLINNIQLTGKHETERKNAISLGIAPSVFFRRLKDAQYLEITFTPVDYITRKK